MEEEDKKFNITVGDDGIIYLSLAGNLEGLNLVALQHWSTDVHNVIKDRYEKASEPPARTKSALPSRNRSKP